jgi:hypothetical protein
MKSSSSKSEPVGLTTEDLLYELANLHDDAVPKFRKKWDKVFKRYTRDELLARRDELKLLWTSHHAHLETVTAKSWNNVVFPRVTPRTEALHSYWENAYDGTLEQCICDHWISLERNGWRAVWTTKEKALKANPRSLPSVLAWSCINTDRLGFCRNAKCGAPFFLARRADQLFCTTECAWPAQKAAKLKWWHENRAKKSVETRNRIKGDNDVTRQKG